MPPPSGIVDGDILIAFAVSDSAGTTFTWPAGFTAVPGTPLTSTADGQRLGCATKKASGEAGNYTLTQGGADNIIGGVICVSGRDAVNFLHQSSATSSSVANASPWSITSAAFAASTTGLCDLLFIGGSDVTTSGDAVHAAPAGFTLQADLSDGGFENLMVATKDGASAGETGVYTGTGTLAAHSSGWCVFAIALLAAAGSGSSPMFH